MFAKLFNTTHGQTLVKIDEGEEGPEVRCYWQPQGLGVCSAAVEFPDNHEGWAKAETLFSDLGEEGAAAFITAVAKRGEPIMAALATNDG